MRKIVNLTVASERKREPSAELIAMLKQILARAESGETSCRGGGDGQRERHGHRVVLRGGRCYSLRRSRRLGVSHREKKMEGFQRG